MNRIVQGLLSLLGRVLLSAIFLSAAAMNHIPKFSDLTARMEAEGVPAAPAAHVLAIAFLLVGGISLVVGYWARIGATLLLIFLILAAYYFHDFWTFEGDQAMQQQIHFMKNVAMMGAMLLVIANGPGAWSLDNRLREPVVTEA